MPGILSGLALAGASIFVFPGLGDTIREPKWLWLWAFALLMLGHMIWRKKRPAPFPAAFWVFVAYLLIQPYFFSAAHFVWPFTLCLLSLGIISACASTEGKAFDRILLIATVLQLTQGALQCLGWDFLFRQHAHMVNPHPLVGFLGQQTIFGAWMAPIAWYWFGRKKWWVFAACTIAVFATGSAFSIFAWLAGLGALLVWKKPRWGLFFFAGVGAVGVIALTFNQDTEGPIGDNYRFLAWRMILSASLREPWFGYGIDSFAREFRFHQGFGGAPWLQAHSEPLELFFGGGIVGVILGLWAVSALWFRRNNWWGKKDCLPWFLALMAIFANALGNFPFHIAPIALLAWISYSQLVRPSSD